MDLKLYKKLLAILGPQVELRHDVDISLEAALCMAEIDFAFGRKSIFYIRPCCRYYSPDPWILERIKEFGHEIGAHIDSVSDECDLYPTLVWANQFFDFEKFTFHINTDQTAKFDRPFYKQFINKNIVKDYTSDSRGSGINVPRKGVLNIHPEWWVYPGDSPKEKLEYYFNQQKDKCIKEILPDLHS
jgi:hypothetical protein